MSSAGATAAADAEPPAAVPEAAAAAALRKRLDAVPLSSKLVALLLALTTLGLAVTGAAAAGALRGYLVGRVDERLAEALVALTSEGQRPSSFSRPPGGQLEVLNEFFVQVNTPTGEPLYVQRPVMRMRHSGRGSDMVLPPLDLVTVLERGRRAFEVRGAGGPWRAMAAPWPGQPASIVVALPLREVSDTVRRLLLLNIGVALLVLLALAWVASWLVRSSLRPLVEVERTAAAIAAGNLSQRVPPAHPRTEVGRLSSALNGMLAQIESAFRGRAASEADARAAESKARASEDRMRRFVADAGHELRTPLTSIRGFAELYRQGAVPQGEEVSRVMRRIEEDAQRMGLLVEDLLLLARLDQERPLERVPVDLAAVAADVTGSAVALAPSRRIELEPAAADVVVRGDEQRLRQVVQNLVSNAVVHTPPDAAITVRLRTEADEAVLEVADEGQGMAPEQAERVFERFYRADPSRTRAQGGSGLGLSIVSALVAAHGGTVTVDTAPGEGSCFRVRLPLARG